jgi:Domain of unknown function (DUF4395)
MDALEKIDHTALRVNQIVIICINITAFLFNLPWLAVLVALVMVIGALLGVPGFRLIYRYILKPLGWVKPEVLMDNPEPHRFAQGLGGVFMAAGSIALYLGYAALGWSLVWLVSGLAALNAFGGFCVGCMVYYWLSRLHIPGFRKTPPGDTFPGRKPQTRVGQQGGL